MNFIIVEITEGGADVTDSDHAGVLAYLNPRHGYWKRALKEFTERVWTPGEWMEYPCGYIFCVKENTDAVRRGES